MNIKKNILLFILSLLSLPYFGQNKMGVNLSGGTAFVNVMDQGSRFTNITSTDSEGWPNSDFTQIFDWRLVAEWVGPADDPQQYRYDLSGTYQCSFIGDATVTAPGATISNQNYDVGTNTTTFDVTVPSTNNGRIFWQMNFTNTKKTSASPTNSGISKLRINRPGYPLSTTQTFTTEYINLCTSASFVCYRYYTLNNVWQGAATFPAVSTWANRKLPTDANQGNMMSVNGKVEGWCWEYVIELANILQKDIWINLNVSVDDDYVTNLATKLQNELNPNINIYVEYGNEVWNPNYQTADFWVRDEAANLGISFDQNYARNVVRISNLFKNVYGASAINNKIRVVLGAQQGWIGRTTTHLNYIQNNFGPPKDYIWATAPSTYYSGTGATIEEALNECHTSIMKHYDDSTDVSSLLDHIQNAKTWQLPGVCVSYEGQEHGSIGSTSNLPVEIGKHRDARMATEQYVNFQSFFDNGGTLACQFGLWSPYTRYGCWGLTDDPFNPDRDFKFRAARTLCGDVVNAMPVPTPPDAPTCLTVSTLSSTEKELSWTDNATTEDGYEIWSRDSTSSTWKYYATVGPDNTLDTFVHSPGETFEFRVRAYNFSQWSAYNNCPTDIENTSKEHFQFHLYPNPSSQQVNISFTAIRNGNVKFIISDLSSKKVMEFNREINNGYNNIEVSTAHLINGIYLITMEDNEHKTIQKMVIQN